MDTTVRLDFSRRLGRVRAMHAVGQPPFPHMSPDYLHYLTEAHIPYSRLHDVGGMFGGNMYVDIPNVFRDFSANEYDPASYDFGFTDELLKALDKNGVKPIYRLGVTIENFFEIRAYRIFPPADYGKWARICEHIIRHYNEGWAGGFHFGIEYWEIWNEPEDGPGSGMWRGTDLEFFRLYEVASKHLKETFGDAVKVGGYASCGLDGAFQNPAAFGLPEIAPRGKTYRYYFAQYAEKFFRYISERDCPLDFFSWHCYINTDDNPAWHCRNVEDAALLSRVADHLLQKYGYGGAEQHLNEWNNAWQLEHRGTAYAAAAAAAMMITMQNTRTELLCYYDARIGESCFGGMFNPLNYKPLPVYYAFKAFGELYALGTQVFAGSDNKNVYALAAANEDGERALLLANTGEDTAVTLLGGAFDRFYPVDETHDLTSAEPIANGRFLLKKNQTALLTDRPRP
ncbi:MAG: hypothetical protein IJJ85_09550 [Clostridia bacterium]|nr:hypothetical protein [Clostridia bacterium]